MIYTRDFIDGGKKPDPLTQFNSSFGEWMLGALHKKQGKLWNCSYSDFSFCSIVCAQRTVLPSFSFPFYHEWMSIGSESAPKRVKWSKKSQLISIAIKI